jgi:hypothetical protein
MGREARIILASALLGSLSTAVTPAAAFSAAGLGAALTFHHAVRGSVV